GAEITEDSPVADAASEEELQVPREPIELADATLTPEYSPLAPGTAIDISAGYPQPGQYFNFSYCTVAYSFSTEDGRSFAVTASHCGQEGNLVWAGTPDNSFGYPAEPIGTFIYSSLYSESAKNLDIGLIELNGNLANVYAPQDMDTHIAGRMEALPDYVCKMGRMTYQTCGDLTHQSASSILRYGEEEISSTAARAAVCARNGDSGGPVYAMVEGQDIIVGLVSGTTVHMEEGQTCADVGEMELSFVSILDIHAVLDQLLDSPMQLATL
uniref:trypsin-like serine protease n=1 Tax=Corynebacterium stationis TaxID=1705 RepID=UPI00174C31CB